jgi:tetratricopeptide (TPR) repeat protein
MAKSKEERSAQDYYLQAHDNWAEILGLSVYDDEDVLGPVAGTLERALRIDPNHVKSLALLSDLQMQMGAYDEARELVSQLITLQPDAAINREKLALLSMPDRLARRDAIRRFLERKWNVAKDW